MKQSKLDSWVEAIANVGVGFIISWLVWVVLVGPLFGIRQSAGDSLLIVCLFTITSMLRSYWLRRLFNGRTVGEALLSFIHRRDR